MAIDRLKLALFLTDPENDWVRAIAETAKEATRRRGFTLTTQFSENQAIEQIQSLYAALRLPEDQRPNAILVMPVHDQSLERVARAAAGAGVAWICLHRATGDLAALRRQFPTVPITLVGPDQDEIGRIHGRQLLSLLPRGGHVLYVQGRHDNLSTQQRAAGMREVIQGSAVEISAVIDGDWGTMEAERSVSRWLRLIGPGTPVDVVVCQNDAMAIGARRGLKEAATALARPALAQLPVFGCDGLPDVGRKLVDQGELAGTIILPSPAIMAIDMLVQALETQRMPAVQVLLTPQAYPARLTARGVSPEPTALPH
jgi:inositol transport system substrate-binding protein